MKLPYVTILLAILVIWAGRSPQQDGGALDAIRKTALDYGEGWYEGDADRMERALHPELAKRMIYTHPINGRSRLHDMGAMSLVRGTRAGGGSTLPARERVSDVEILDVFENAAVAKVTGPEWIDYLHLAQWNGRWVIVNVLWELRPEHRDRLSRLIAGV